MGSPEDLVSHHVTVLRRCGLSDEAICEVYGVSDPPDDVSVGRIVMASLDGEPTPRNLYDQTHRVLATAPRGIDAPRDYPNRVVPQQLNTVMGAFGFSMHFLDGNGEPLDSGAEPSQPFRIALEDPNGNVRTTTFEYPDTGLGEHNYPALVAAIQSDLLDGVPLTFAMLSDWADERWRFVLLEADRLDALEQHYGDGIECFGEPLLHEHTPAEFASGQAVAQPADEAAAGSGTSDAGDDGDGDIGVDESTEGWLGSGGSDLSDVDLDGSTGDDTGETDDADDVAVETGLEDIFSTIEEDATAGGDSGVEIESTGKTVEDLVGATTADADESPAATEPTAAEPAEADPEPATEPGPTADEADTEPEPATTEPATGGTADADTPEPAEAEPAAAEPATEPEATATESDPLDAGEDDDGGFVMADPEPARAEPEEPATAGSAVDTADEPAADPETSAEPGDAEPATEPEPAQAETEPPEATTTESTPEPTPSEPAEVEPEPAGPTSVEAETPQEPASGSAGTEASATADEESPVADEPTSSADPTAATNEPAAATAETAAETHTAETTAAEETTDQSTEDAAAAETSDDSPGFVGRIVAAIKGVF